MRPHRADDGEKIGPGLHERAAIFLGDAADRAARHHCRLGPIVQQLGRGAMLRARFGRAREKCAERDVIGAGFGGDERAVAARAASHADDAIGAQEPTRLGIGRVLLADVDAVAIELGGEVGAVLPIAARNQRPLPCYQSSYFVL